MKYSPNIVKIQVWYPRLAKKGCTLKQFLSLFGNEGLGTHERRHLRLLQVCPAQWQAEGGGVGSRISSHASPPGSMPTGILSNRISHAGLPGGVPGARGAIGGRMSPHTGPPGGTLLGTIYIT